MGKLTWMMGKVPYEGVGTWQDHAAAHKSPQANGCVSWLLSKVMAGLGMGSPRINTFSGDATPGKTEVSFEQWYHKVQCVKNHCLEALVWESIIRSLKGAVADMSKFMGPTGSIDHILWKLSNFWHSGFL